MTANSDEIRNMIRRGHRTSNGRQLVARWRPVATIQPHDVLASLRAGTDASSARAELERALNARTWAEVEVVYSDDVNTTIHVTTRMGTPIRREWRNVAQLPVLRLEESVSPSGQTLESPNGARDDSTTTPAQEATP